MQRLYIFSALLGLTACAGAYQQPYAAPQPTIGQTQGQCFASSQRFIAQTDCIANTVAASGATPNTYAQEYLTYMQSLQEKVRNKALSENDARAKLASKLNEVRALQQNEDAMQEQLANQRAAQNAEILRQYQYKAPQLEMPQRRSPAISSPINTTCQNIGNQMQCTSR
jgi:hypothetical protein